jgi:diadenosine tetraphosphate (Ap4A) HIT family hydrolase
VGEKTKSAYEQVTFDRTIHFFGRVCGDWNLSKKGWRRETEGESSEKWE